jgi:hypothetical protein
MAKNGADFLVFWLNSLPIGLIICWTVKLFCVVFGKAFF